MTMVEEVLATWRDAERLLDTLSPVGPEHETVRLTVVGLQASYRDLTGERARTEEVIAASRATMVEAHRVIDAIRASHAREPNVTPAT
jgi:hypothetical protein